MGSQWHSAFAPATVANVGPGFDVLGFALDAALGLGDRVEVRRREGEGLVLSITGDGGRLPTDPEKNVAGVAARSVLDRVGASGGLEIRLEKGLPLGSGLGSSAASAVASALAVNAALGDPLRPLDLLDACREGERVAAGFPHPDNVLPALIGGFLLMVEDERGGLAHVSLPIPAGLRVAVAIPELEVRTEEARAAIPERVPLADAVSNAAHLGLLVSALHDGDLARLARALRDRLHEPYRIPLVPGYEEARARALEAGAAGVGLSGSGPAVFAFAEGDAAASLCGAALVEGFAARGIEARSCAGRIAPSER